MGMASGANKDGVVSDGNASLKALKTKKVKTPWGPAISDENFD